MNHNEEVPDFLGGLGDMLPADVLKKVNELLEHVHRKDKDHQGSPVFIYAPGSQYVDKQFNFGKPHTPETLPVPPCVGRGRIRKRKRTSSRMKLLCQPCFERTVMRNYKLFWKRGDLS